MYECFYHTTGAASTYYPVLPSACPADATPSPKPEYFQKVRTLLTSPVVCYMCETESGQCLEQILQTLSGVNVRK